MIDVIKSWPQFWQWFRNLTWVQLITPQHATEPHMMGQSYVRSKTISTNDFQVGHGVNGVIKDAVSGDVFWINRLERGVKDSNVRLPPSVPSGTALMG